MSPNQQRIFVAIAAYRDPEISATLADMFAKAQYPERITAGICLQYDPVEDAACAITSDRMAQLRLHTVHYQESQGANWARHIAIGLRKAEEYILQIDSHMRFEPGWDETLIAMLARCPSDKPVISAYLPNYTPPNTRDVPKRHLLRIRANKFGAPHEPQLLHLTGHYVPMDEPERGGLYPTPFVIGNFIFCRAAVYAEVPVDPHFQFYGDEISFSARLWTHGYDIFQPDCVIAFHYWVRKETMHLQHYRNTRTEKSRCSALRVRHLLGLASSDDVGALAEIERYGLGQARALADLWAFAGVNFTAHTIAPDALEGRWDLVSRERGSALSPAATARIFVQIASYRDPECQWTVKDLFEKAAHPERVFIGICWQFDPEKDQACFAVPSPRPEQVRVVTFTPEESKGAGWARMQAQELWDGEEYILQIHPHMRAEQGWDTLLIETLARCPAERPVLSTFLPGYKPPNTLSFRDEIRAGYVMVNQVGATNDVQMVHLYGGLVNTHKSMPSLMRSPFWVGNFLFAKSTLMQDVPFDPHVFFYGEEISYSARLWTHGYDIFQPDRLILYHWWGREHESSNTYKNTQNIHHQRTHQRVRHLLRLTGDAPPEARVEIDRYGLGSARSLESYWTFAGINLVTGTVQSFARKGQFDEAYTRACAHAEGKAPPLPRIFVEIASYRDPECQWTVKDLFEKAAYPERIFVGICWQFDCEKDQACFAIPYPRPAQVRVHEVDAKTASGVCWSRSLTQKLWRGEAYVLQIDSHMRFEPGWDEMMIEELDACDSPKPVLSCYPAHYSLPNILSEDKSPNICCVQGFNEYGNIRGKGNNLGFRPEKPMRGAFLAGGFIFSRSDILAEVPYDPHYDFEQEEITYALRLFTHGWDIFSATRVLLYHNYNLPSQGKVRPSFWDERSEEERKRMSAASRRGLLRFNHLTGHTLATDPEVLVEMDKYPLGTVRTVQQFEEFTGLDFKHKASSEKAEKGLFIKEVAEHHEQQLQAAARKNARIFVQIASYRDPECQWTVKDLFEKATRPDRVFVGICWQFDQEEDQHCFQVSTRPDQVRILPVDWREAEGVCWARHQAQQLWDGEEYSLQIDSHMRFVPGWDEKMIAELAACPSTKPVLSCSPASYTPPNQLEEHPRPTIRRVMPFFPDGNLRGKGESLDRVPEKPLNGAFVAGGFVFARSEIINDVPYDPYLYFDQEEITYAARLYTHGWDVFSSRQPLLYHYYNVNGRDSARPLHWNDLRKHNENKIRRLRERGLARFNHLTGYRLSTDVKVTQELERYELGRVRSLEAFSAYCGVDFKRKLASEKALRCLFIQDLAKYRDRPIIVPELDSGASAVLTMPPSPLPVANAPASGMLEPGDFVPMFQMSDTQGKSHNIETHGGRHGMLVFLPTSNAQYVSNFFHHFHQHLVQGEKMNIWMLFILDDTVENLSKLKAALKLPQTLTADPGRAIARAFGLCAAADLAMPPVGYVVNANLKIIRRHARLPAAQLAESLVRDCRAQYEAARQEQASARVISQLPPALIVPQALSPELCARCIQVFRSGRTFDGTVGAGEKLAYAPQAKIRTDHIVQGELLRDIDDKLSRSVFPEIKKVFGFEVTHREFYKIGAYVAEKGGFFRQHRDNFDAPLGYRRIAMTIHLNDDFEGGGLRFPEYDEHVYRPALGSAIAFSCATMHEALPVTKGERFVLVAFLHGDEEEAYRQYYQASKGEKLKVDDFTPVRRQYPEELTLSRNFYTDWQRQHVHYDTASGQADIPIISTPTTGSVMTPPKSKAPAAVSTLGGHHPKKVLETPEAIVFDDFLPEEVYERLYAYSIKTDYKHINTDGKVSRAWHINDGFPLRSMLNEFYYADGVEKPTGDWVYPTKKDMDIFMEHLIAIQPQIEHFNGKMGKDWTNVSATNWIYPSGTGLAMHDDGSGVYTGAYAYFLNPVWKLHWGGLNIMIEGESNKHVYDYRSQHDEMDFYNRKWLNANPLDALLMEHGFGRCIFPKKNRIVFIANNAYHMVTRVNEQCGDNVRMSIAGFYHRK